MKYQVKVKLAASMGIAQTRTVEVEAAGKAEAIVAASLKLDDEKVDRWSLESVNEMSS